MKALKKFDKTIKIVLGLSLIHIYRKIVLQGVFRTEADLLNGVAEFAEPPILADMQFSAGDFGFQPAGREGAQKEELPGVLRQIDEPAASGNLGAEFGNIHVPMGVDLGQPAERLVQPAAMIKVKEGRMGHDAFRVQTQAEIRIALRASSHDAVVYRQNKICLLYTSWFASKD